MPTEVTMPQMGADMTEGTVVRWLKQVGDEVRRGDVIAEIETDKATVELEAFEAGILKQQVVGEGETVPVGDVIALLGAEDEVVDGEVPRKAPAETPARRTIDREDTSAAAAAEARAPIGSAPVQPSAPPTADQGRGEGRLRISPVARRIAGEAGFDPGALVGTGPGGRILRHDVEQALRQNAPSEPAPVKAAPSTAAATAAAAAPRKPSAEEPTVALSRMRQAIARRMTQSKQTQPHYYLTLDIDMTDAMTFREQLNRNADETHRVSVNDLIVKACAIALQRHPRFNSEFADDGLKTHETINIDIGIALEDGLIAPAILDCGNRSLGSIAAAAKDLINRAKSGHLSPEEYSAGTFTITNLGAYGVEALIGIINPPQAAILGVGTVMPKPVVRDDQVVVRQVMKVALSADHRVTNGAEGARFIKEIQSVLESPASLAL